MSGGVLGTLLSIPLLLFGSVTIESYVCQPPDPPTITQPLDGTQIESGKPFIIAGVSTADTIVTLSDNGTVFATTTADQLKHYAIQANLTAGSHTIEINAENPCGSADGTPITIEAFTPITPPKPPIVKIPDIPDVSTPPAPVVTFNPPAPADGSLAFTEINLHGNLTTSSSSVLITGETNLAATFEVLIGNKVVSTQVRPDTTFGFTIPLSLGSNAITIKAWAKTDSATHTLSITRIHANEVIYTGDRAGLQQGTRADTAEEEAWYQTTPGKIAVVSSAIILILLIFILLL